MATKASSTKTASRTKTAKASPDSPVSPSPTPKAKTKAKTEKTAFTATQILKLSKDTSGALAYKAVDSKGNVIDQDATALSQVYLRKAKTTGAPEFIELTVRAIPGLSAKPTPDADGDED